MRPIPAPSCVRRACEVLMAAKTPFVVLGGGAVDAAPQARALIEYLGAPTANSVNAKGILEPGHVLYAGDNLSCAPIREALATAGVVLAVGCEFGESERYGNTDEFHFGGALVRIDIDAQQLMRGFPAHIPLLGLPRLRSARSTT